MSAQQYALTLKDGTTVIIELEHCGGTLWRHEILHGTPPFHYAFYHTFSECFRVAWLRVEERFGGPVVRCERKTSASDLEAIVRALAEIDPVWRDGDCVCCREWLGCPTEEWLEANDGDWDKVTPETPRMGKHKGDCLWLRARKSLGMD